MIDFEKLDYSATKPENMPTETMEAIAESTSVKTAIIIMEYLGGRIITIPVKKQTGLYAELVTVCGVEATDTIFAYFKGQTISIPVRRSVLPYIISQLSLNTEMISYLIHAYGVARNTIYNMLKKRPKSYIKNGFKVTLKSIEEFL